jgi:signal transduction histidine kinase
MEGFKVNFSTGSVFINDMKCGSVLAVGDPFRIEQVITNFLNNAIENTPPGKEIRLVSENGNENVMISIYNQGKNIDEDEISRIWEKFYRIEKSRNKSFGGTGLGLAISRAILELHGSSFGVQNTQGGVRFFFTLEKS